MFTETASSPRAGGHAVVIGGSIAGLLAARVLAERFERVTIVERDRFPEGVDNRKGVPHGRHAHALLARGQIIVGGLFPGLAEGLVRDGAITYDGPAESRWYQPGGYRARFETGRVGVMMSRPLLEWHVRQRVLALPNVAILPGRAVSGLLSNSDRACVTGVTLRWRDEGAEELSADLVVDAGGRGSRAPAWLEALGYERPLEEEIKIGVGYTTRLYRRRPGDLPGAKFVIVQPTPPHERRCGAMFQIEGERWMVTLGGWLGDHAPPDEEGFLAFAHSLPAPEIHDVIKGAESLGEAATYRFPANLRRRYERLSRVPEGYLVTGDALCSFNPIYGQGMTVSAMEAEALAACLQDGSDGLPGRFYRRVSEVIDTPWLLAAGADFAYRGVVGSKAPTTDLFNWYLGRVQRAATRDREVCRALVGVTQLLAPPAALFHPRIAFRVLRQTLSPSKTGDSETARRSEGLLAGAGCRGTGPGERLGAQM
jgi:2-polyprenyl-6-methoxyphenol hydroxylase-like FAD-dependent oxidoreductase